MPWDFAVPDWADRLRAGQSLMPDLPLDMEAADRAAAIFDNLRVPDVPGQPAMREAAGDWFRDIVRALNGSIDEQGVRQVAEVFCLVPKKNSKTTNGAALMLTALLLNERPRAEFLLIGPTQEIADTAFSQAAGMIEADPEGYLPKRFQVQQHLKAIRDRRNGAFLKVKTFDMKVVTGSKPVGVLIDELHILSSYSYASRVIRQIRGGRIANPEGFLVFITTQSDESPAGVFRSELQYARGVRDGRVTEANMLPVLYEFPEALQTGREPAWREPDNWPMVTPNLGRSISLPAMQADYRTAVEKGEDEVRLWASQHLNVEIGLGLHSERWRGADYWEAAADPALVSLDELIARSDVAVAGIDGGGLDDLLGLAFMGRCRETRDWLLWGHGWCQSDVLEIRKDIAERLRDFERDGDLTICRSVTQDVEDAAALVRHVADAGLLPAKHAVGLDPVGVAALVDELAAQGIADEQVVAVSQGFRLSSAVWGLERKLKDMTLRHGGQRLMAWCVGNAKAEARGNAVLITKQAAGKAKIDPLVAAFNATMLMSRNPEAGQQRSPWEDEDFRISA